jgi:hydroxymethylbilane synthase
VGALIMAAAGLHRAGFADRITEYLDPAVSLPAPGQGALAVEIRTADPAVAEVVGKVHHAPTAIAVDAERALLGALQGGCQVPIGAHARLNDGMMTLEGLIASPDGKTVIRHSLTGPAAEGRALGVQLAEWLLANGGKAILDSLR